MTATAPPPPAPKQVGALRIGLSLSVIGALVWSIAACSPASHPVSGQPTSPTSPQVGAGRSASVHRASTHRPAPVRPPKPAAAALAAPVHVSLYQADGKTYGIGMPIVMRFTQTVTDARALEQAVTVTVNGAPATGAWYWERSGAAGYAVEAHYRMRTYWPAHARITVNAPLAGLSAGPGLSYDGNLTLAIMTGAAHVSTVDNDPVHPMMTVKSDGKIVKTMAVSLGQAATPTYRGTKVVMEFDRYQQMGTASVPWSVRLTNSGEFAHAAPWNSQIGRANLSHGCTNLSVTDAQWLFEFSLLGDVVDYPNAPGPVMQVWDGLGDWNVPWPAWRAGGLLPSS